MVAVSLAVAAALGAASPEVPETQFVTYADLDLNSAAGRDRLERRVRSAADRLCRIDNTASPQGGYVNLSCFNAAVADGLSQVQLAVAHFRKDQAAAPARIKLARR